MPELFTILKASRLKQVKASVLSNYLSEQSLVGIPLELGCDNT
jgi:hypothetical protein